MADSFRGNHLFSVLLLVAAAPLILNGCNGSQQTAVPDAVASTPQNSRPAAPPPAPGPSADRAPASGTPAVNPPAAPAPTSLTGDNAGYAQGEQPMAGGDQAAFQPNIQTSYEPSVAGQPADDSSQGKHDLQLPTPYVRPPGWKPTVGLEVGNVAPEIAGEDVEGKAFRLSEYRGRVVVLDFWADWCPYCREMYPHERSLVTAMEGRPFALLGINTDKRAQLTSTIGREGITWRSWWDLGSDPPGAITKQYQVRGIPMIYVLDHQGVICYKNVRGPKLDAAIEQLLPLAESADPAEATALPILSARALEMREWKDATGQFSVIAAFVKFEDGKAHLEREDDGKVIQVSMGKLCDEDQQFIRALLRSNNRSR